ncbi:MAG: hypothetical protein Q8934_12815 [Bacillota bacterium]|nr:hypothetical protein [Bacillota bacterium]
MREKRIVLFTFAILIAVFLLLHSTPNLALRTNVFFSGHPIKAISTGIIDDKFHNENEKEKFARLNAKAYTLTKPPFEKGTGSWLRNYLVRKIGFLYFADYLGEA